MGYKPSGHIGSYKYFTIEDLQAMYYDSEDMEDPAYHMKMAMLDIASLTQRYAVILHDYESRYIDDGR